MHTYFPTLNIILVLRLFERFRPFSGFRKAERKTESKKIENFTQKIVQENSQSFLTSLFVCCHNVLRFLVYFPKLLLSIEKKDFNFHRNSFYTDNSGLRLLYSSPVQYRISCSFIAYLRQCYITVLVMSTTKFPTSARSHDGVPTVSHQYWVSLKFPPPISVLQR